MVAHPGLRLLVLGLLLSLAMSCTHSRLSIQSDPPGAEVFFDGKPKGTTPVDFDFKWYGKHKVVLRKDEYQDKEEIINLRPPLHYQIPLDLVTELIPAEIRDHQKRQFELVPIESTEKQGPPEL